MKHGPYIFTGVFLAFACSFGMLVLAPELQLSGLTATTVLGGDTVYPAGRSGLALQGAQVYRASGCAECHTQQTRPQGYGSDFERGWGKRRSVARDFVIDQPVMLGAMRLGPDLANIGTRSTTNFAVAWKYSNVTNAASEAAAWHLLHLYNPRTKAPDSKMPAYPWLFEKRSRKPSDAPSPDALEIPTTFAPEPGVEIVPRQSAKALVAYLQSLQAEASLPEMEVAVPKPKVAATNAPVSNATNAAPTAVTNAPKQ